MTFIFHEADDREPTKSRPQRLSSRPSTSAKREIRDCLLLHKTIFRVVMDTRQTFTFAMTLALTTRAVFGSQIEITRYIATHGPDTIATNVTVSTTWARSRIACSLACTETTGCGSYNFNRNLNVGRYHGYQCDLIDGGQPTPDFIPQSGGTYYTLEGNVCQNGGTGVFEPPSSYHCLCPSLYSGSRCENCAVTEYVSGEVTTLTVDAGGTTTDIDVNLEQWNGQTWIMLMRRMDGSVNFDKDWPDYKAGFGNLCGEFWLGNDNMYLLTNNGSSYTVRFDLMSSAGESRWAEYSVFRVADETDNYILTIDNYSGNAGDATTQCTYNKHNGRMFSTRDRDHDNHATNCAAVYGAGWWFNYCYCMLLTGRYGEGIYWHPWLGRDDTLLYADMKISVQ